MPSQAIQRYCVSVALLALTAACSAGSPGQPGSNPSAGGGASRPQAAPGLGVNPSVTAPAAPLPAGGNAARIDLGDPSGLPFVDPTSEAGKTTNLFFEGTWALSGAYLEQSLGARRSSLTFRQYSGGAFGSQGGVAPAKYRADVTVWVYQPSDQYPDMVGAPLGIIGYAPYFIDETHYLLVVAKPRSLEAWEVDGYVPGSEWPLKSRLWQENLTTELAVGTPVTWSVEVDTASNSAKIWANGEEKATVATPLISNRGQRVALVSNGNYLHFQDFKLFKL